MYLTNARLAQLVERKTFNLVVVGSSPTVDNNFYFILGNVPERSKGSDLSSDALRFVGSNPTVTKTLLFYFVPVAQLDSASDF